MNLGLEKRAAVVLASSTGLGFAVAETLAGEGARVAISGRDGERLRSAEEQLRGRFGGRIWAEALDVRDLGALERHLRGARERFGGVDILVTNSGGPPPGTASGIDVEGLEDAYRLLLAPAVHAIRTVLPWMRERRWGRIIGLTSIAVRQPFPDLALSNTLRAGLTGYLKSLSVEVAAEGVLVNSICTGLFATERLLSLYRHRAGVSGKSVEEEAASATAQIPAGRFGEPKELAAVAAFLASEQASFVTGVALPVDGGAGRGLL